MINFSRFTLDNGLRVVVHEDPSTPMVAVNVLYDVGARDESPEKTGFAHLFEHLMFGGSKNIPDFDNTMQMAGGECNAFTNNDITNFYNLVPAKNLEIALWMESDRMMNLNFDAKSLEVQRKVVVEANLGNVMIILIWIVRSSVGGKFGDIDNVDQVVRSRTGDNRIGC